MSCAGSPAGWSGKALLGMVTGILTALEMLEQNANLRLLADNLLLEFPRLN